MGKIGSCVLGSGGKDVESWIPDPLTGVSCVSCRCGHWGSLWWGDPAGSGVCIPWGPKGAGL